MDKISAAYLAGLMDGEGCFRIERFNSDASPIGVQYRCVIEISMCEREPIEFAARLSNRKVYEKTLPSGRVCYKLVWRNTPAADLIRAILPYLKAKRKEAELCLHYEDNLAVGRGRTYTPDDAVRIEAVRQQVIGLKRPGALRC